MRADPAGGAGHRRGPAGTGGPARPEGEPRQTGFGLFIGASEYADTTFGDRPPVAASARALADAMGGNGVWDMPEERRRVLAGTVTKNDVLKALDVAARAETGLLMVYIGCHGRRFPSQPALDLALSDSLFPHFSTHLPFLEIKDALNASEARMKLLLVDCCYADDAFLGTRSQDVPTMPGVWTITATALRVEAVASWHRTPYTAFAGALLDVLRKGVPDAGHPLSVQEAFTAMHGLLNEAGRPEPGIRSSGAALPLYVNNTYRSAPAEPDPAAAEAAVADPVAWAGRVAARGGGREAADDAHAMLTAFVRERPALPIARLARAFATADRRELAVSTALTAVRLGDAVESAALVHFLHDDGLLPADLLFETLGELAAAGFGALVTELCRSGCVACLETAGELAAAAGSADWSTASLVRVLGTLTGDGTPGRLPAAAGGRLVESLDGDRLADIARGLWLFPGPGRAARRLHAVALAERAAERTPHGNLLALAARLAHGAPDVPARDAAAPARGADSPADAVPLPGPRDAAAPAAATLGTSCGPPAGTAFRGPGTPPWGAAPRDADGPDGFGGADGDADGTAELARVALESVAGRADAGVLARLLRLTAADRRPLGPADTLRTAVVRRRSPALLAEVLRRIAGPGGAGVRGRAGPPDDPGRGAVAVRLLLEAAARHGTVRDLVRVVVTVHGGGPALPAVEAVVAELAAGMDEAQVAAAVVLLDRYGDRAAVGALLARAAGPGAADASLPGLLRLLGAGGPAGAGPPPLVAEALRWACEREPAARLRLFALLVAAGLDGEARQVLRSLLDLDAPAGLADAVLAHRRRHRPDDGPFDVLLRELVRVGDVEAVYHLGLAVRGEYAAADAVIGRAVAELWPVPRIENLATRLTKTAWPVLARQLMRYTVERLAESGDPGGSGTRTAQVLVALRRTSLTKPDGRQTRALVRRLAGYRQPVEVMDLIAGLLDAKCYQEYRKTVEREVLDAFGWRELAGLPGVRGVECLPAVLEIVVSALVDPGLVPAARFPDLVVALLGARTGRLDLDRLLGHVGYRRTMDDLDVISGLNAAGLGAEADAFAARVPHHRPEFFAL